MNKIILAGACGKDPKVKEINGKKVATLTFATNERKKGADGVWKTEPVWHHLELWDDMAEFAETHMKKGRCFLVEGRIRHGQYEKDNITRYTTDVVVDRAFFISCPKSGEERMETLNRVILGGCLGKNSEMRFTQSQKKVARNSLATDGGGKTTWHRLVAFGDQADFLEKYGKIGVALIVEGHLSYSHYEKEGVKLYSTEVLVDRVSFAPKGAVHQAGAEDAPKPDIF